MMVDDGCNYYSDHLPRGPYGGSALDYMQVNRSYTIVGRRTDDKGQRWLLFARDDGVLSSFKAELFEPLPAPPDLS